LNGRKIASDLLLASSYHLLEKLVGYVVLLLMARHLSVGRMGEFFFAVAVASFLALFTELGTHNYLIRRVANEPGDAARALSEVLSLRLPVMGLVFLLLNGAVAVVEPELLRTMLLTSIFVLLQELYYSFGAAFLGLRRVGLRVATGLGAQILLAILVAAAVAAGSGLATILLAYVGSSLALVVVAAVAARRWVGPFRPVLDSNRWRAVAVAAAPLFALGAVGWLHSKVDTMMLGVLGSYEAVASYEVAYKFFEVSRFAIRPIAMIFFPLCAGLVAAGDWPALRRLTRRIMLSVVALGLAAAAFVLPLAELLIVSLFGTTYQSSTGVLQVLFLGAPALYSGMVGVFVATAMRQERKALILTAICLLANVVANAIVIPLWGALGAAWTTVATETILGVGLVVAVFRRVSKLHLATATATNEDSAGERSSAAALGVDRDATL
jgi:O-antigen/teichoic acid export membrane protein